MFIDAIDKLRCVNEHEDSWLVAKFVEMRDRHFWEGELGCLVCEARYPVKEGIVYFDQPRSSPDERSLPVTHSSDDLFALAAMLDLSAPGRTVVLCDAWADYATEISEISQPHVFALNPRESTGAVERIYEIVTERSIPLAAASADAVALDVDSSAHLVQSAVKILRDGGRMVAMTGMPLPGEMQLLASDDRKWVAQKRGDFIPLHRANR